MLYRLHNALTQRQGLVEKVVKFNSQKASDWGFVTSLNNFINFFLALILNEQEENYKIVKHLRQNPSLKPLDQWHRPNAINDQANIKGGGAILQCSEATKPKGAERARGGSMSHSNGRVFFFLEIFNLKKCNLDLRIPRTILKISWYHESNTKLNKAMPMVEFTPCFGL